MNGQHDNTLSEAHHWRAVIADDPTPAEVAEFQTWLSADPRHPAAYERALMLWQGMANLPRPSGRSAARKPMAVASWAGTIAAGVLVSLVLFAIYQTGSGVSGPEPMVHQTSAGELRTVDLNDGTRIVLGGAADLKYINSADQRLVVLSTGDAYFDVAHDANKPFVVVAPPARVEVTGTTFSIERRGLTTKIQVASGSVDVNLDRSPIKGGAALCKGQSILVNRAAGISAAEQIPEEFVASWRTGRLIFSGTPLKDVISALNRYAEQEIVLMATDLANEPVTATLKIGDRESSLAMLAATFGLQIQHTPTMAIISQI